MKISRIQSRAVVSMVWLIAVLVLLFFTRVGNGVEVYAASEAAGKPVLNAAVSNGVLTVQTVGTDSMIRSVTVNGYEYPDRRCM